MLANYAQVIDGTVVNIIVLDLEDCGQYPLDGLLPLSGEHANLAVGDRWEQPVPALTADPEPATVTVPNIADAPAQPAPGAATGS